MPASAQARGEYDQREGHSERDDRAEGFRRDAEHQPVRACSTADLEHSLDDDGEDSSLHAEHKQAAATLGIAQFRVSIARLLAA